MFARPIDGIVGDNDRLSLTAEAKKPTPAWAATVFNCSMAGRYTSQETTSTFFCVLSSLASLPTVVVFPPWTSHQHNCRWGGRQIESGYSASPIRAATLMHNADQRLFRTQRTDHFFADCLFLNRGNSRL